jgi:hypothetical protein
MEIGDDRIAPSKDEKGLIVYHAGFKPRATWAKPAEAGLRRRMSNHGSYQFPSEASSSA